MNLGDRYGRTRTRTTALLRNLDDVAMASAVPGTPAWTVLDVARHLTGVAADVMAGRIEGAATDPWTARQVEERQDRSANAVLDEWDEAGSQIEASIDAFGGAAIRLVIDALTHEHDIRGALRLRPDPAAGEDIDWAVQQLVTGVDRSITSAGLPALRIEVGTDEYLLGGAGEPAATLHTDHFELFRAVMGRRSVWQWKAYDWTGDAGPYVAVLPLFGPAADDITE